MIPLDKIRMGYFILYKNDGSFFGNSIMKHQLAAGFSPEAASFTHVEVSGGENHAINISPPLSKLVDITQAHKGRYTRVYRYKNDAYEGCLRYKVAYFSASLCNRGYDIRGVLGFIFKWLKHDNRFYFCSEGALWSLQMVFPKALSISPEKCMPAHFTDPRDFELVWEGFID